MVQIVGKYEYESSENFEEFVKAMGLVEMATPFMGSKPTVEVSKNGDQWTIAVTSKGKTSSSTFKLNEPYEEKLPSFDKKFPVSSRVTPCYKRVVRFTIFQSYLK